MVDDPVRNATAGLRPCPLATEMCAECAFQFRWTNAPPPVLFAVSSKCSRERLLEFVYEGQRRFSDYR